MEEITLVASDKCGWELAEECEYYLEDGRCCSTELCKNIILVEA